MPTVEFRDQEGAVVAVAITSSRCHDSRNGIGMNGNENSYVEGILDVWPSPDAPDITEAVKRAESALHELPNSPRLWTLYGDLQQLSPEETSIDSAMSCYKRALEIDPTYFEAYEEIAYLYDAVLDMPENAIKYFDLAIQHGAGQDSVLGLARSLAQCGRKNDALELLAKGGDTVQEVELRTEIEGGLWG